MLESVFTKYFLAALGGALLAFSFTDNHWYFAVIGLALYFRQLAKYMRRTRVKLSFVFSFVYLAMQLRWVSVLGEDAWLLLTLIAALPWLIVALPNLQLKQFRSQIILTSFVVTCEVIRSHFPWQGFPWSLIAYSQTSGPLLEYAQIGGQSLVTFIVCLLALQFCSLQKTIRSITFVFAVLAGTYFITNVQSVGTVKVVAIQGNVPRLGLDLTSQRAAVFNNHLNETIQYLSHKDVAPKLIVWPESSTDIDPFQNREVAAAIDKLVQSNNIPILVGATIHGLNPSGPRNAGIFWTPTDNSEIYIKNQLVPFGEYLPLRNVLATLIDRFKLIPNDYVPGTELGIFNVAGIEFGDVICFEVAYGDYMRRLVNSGAQFITVQTNNATYGRTAQPEQQFQITRFRAVEHGRAILVASTSGISGAIDQNGQVLAKTNEFVSANVNVDLPVVSAKTISDKYPRWLTIVCLFITFITVLKRVFPRPFA